MITGNEPAFAQDYDSARQGTIKRAEVSGLTIRQEFAARAMQGLCSNSAHIETFSGKNPTPVPSYIAEIAVNLADALIAELNKQ